MSACPLVRLRGRATKGVHNKLEHSIYPSKLIDSKMLFEGQTQDNLLNYTVNVIYEFFQISPNNSDS